MQCQYKKSDNTQCQANALKNDDFCFLHSPSIPDEVKKEAARKGGLVTKNKIESEPLDEITINKIGDILLLIIDSINRVRTKPFCTKKANTVGYLSNIYLKAFEITNMEKRLTEIENVIVKK